jgi:hypothetical protein
MSDPTSAPQSYPQAPSEIAIAHSDVEAQAHVERIDRAMLNQPRRNNRPEREKPPLEAPSPKVPARASTPVVSRDTGVTEAPKLLGRGDGGPPPPEVVEEARRQLVDSLKKAKPQIPPARVMESRSSLVDAYRAALRRKKN